MDFIRLKRINKSRGGELTIDHPGVLDKLNKVYSLRYPGEEELKVGDCINSMSSVFCIKSDSSISLVNSESGGKVVFRFLELLDKLCGDINSEITVTELMGEPGEDCDAILRVKWLEYELLKGNSNSHLEFTVTSQTYPADIKFVLVKDKQQIRYNSDFLDESMITEILPEILAWRFKNETTKD